MPRFTVVVPVYGVRSYLRACLDSVLQQEFTDLEVVIVDDASPDGSAEVIEEYARADARVRTISRSRNGGLSLARNIALDAARGDYVLFLDGDDTYEPGALAAINRRLELGEFPDLLVFDHVRSYWTGRVAASVFQELLRSTDESTFSLDERPEMVEIFHIACNKAYKTEFLRRIELRFEPGIYEDVYFSYAAMVAAKKIMCLPRPCLNYRQRREGAITASAGKKHFDIFDQYRKLFAFVDRAGVSEEVRGKLHRKMVEHFTFCLIRSNRIPRAHRREYLRDAAACIAELAPADGETTERTPGRTNRAIERGSHLSLTGLRVGRDSVRQARAASRWVRRASSRVARGVTYSVQRARPLDDQLAVFASYWYRPPSCNPAAIYDAMRELAPDMRGVWVVRDGDADMVPSGVDWVTVGSRGYAEVMARAKFLVNNVNFANRIVKRPGQVHIQTHHGTPLKYMGLDQQEFPAAAAGTSFHSLLRRVDRWDYSLVSNDHSAETWGRVYPGSYQNVASGYPRNDVYYTSTAEDVAEIRARLGLPSDRFVLLYAPTMRDYRRGYVPLLDLERVARAIGPDHLLLVRTHYSYGPQQLITELEERGLVRDVSSHPRVEELCLAADGLITDYSSVMFDYANLDRPIIGYVPDWDVYAGSRGVYVDITSGAPGAEPRNRGAYRGPTHRRRAVGGVAGPPRRGTPRGVPAALLYLRRRVRRAVVRGLLLGEELPPSIPIDQRSPAPSVMPVVTFDGVLRESATA
ncbi:bifunctional glycosyltransferase family 2 protein/CDP-glycerol:glycerophosphate glycerophosphotransferase [Spiractinospora alimapuensis]|nr:bifunctional glycosyltransferase family 2 protein/CDP-glycerol:glycerophosphate glycerophosphotransferase [Spiractinospora alimapuensis]QVQ54007.1 bifunctional glycosyltransferase family 2 protein/CDP-glycerol:glycerophosphate glycerophosphotransferase [Spiractinospora alimapuensis]